MEYMFHATFLELDIKIVKIVDDVIFDYKLFDKCEKFPFSVCRMPDLSGNILSFYLLRINHV